MKLWYKKIFVWSLSLILFLGVTASGQSNSFCIGENREIETNIQSCCADQNEGCSNNDSQVGFENCGDCINIELDTPLLSIQSQNDNLNIAIKNLTIQIYNNIYSLSSIAQNVFFVQNLQYKNYLINYSEILSSVIFLC